MDLNGLLADISEIEHEEEQRKVNQIREKVNDVHNSASTGSVHSALPSQNIASKSILDATLREFRYGILVVSYSFV